MTCAECGREMRPYGRPADGRVRHEGRGLCQKCHRRHVRTGTVLDFERLHRSFRDTVEDWELLRSQGYTRADASARMGISKRSLERALAWHATEKETDGT